ncbi:hypothetical protein FRC10_010246 [Ceratobasidium sp. 414]|nr:hypothetical protein FRC10_010246 [Ceratobasidium sp. 414]
MKLVELEMTRLSAALREKPSWWTKFRDEEVLAKWRAEALQQARLMKPSHVACYDKIWRSDRLIVPHLKRKLIDGVSKLEDIPDWEKDWHPRSYGQVLDLVHPSLYPIVYNRTLAYSNNSVDPQKRYLMPVPAPPPGTTSGHCPEDASYHISHRFQWLPTDFVVSEDGKSAKSVSYINNLNPDLHHALHHTIEELIAAFIPLFERVLTDSIPENMAIPERVPNTYSYDETYAPKPDQDLFEGMDQYELAYKQWELGRPYLHPDVPPEGYQIGSREHREFKYTLAGRTIQVIVKLANIHLTPERPTYPGGSWHIEGMLNEAIAASGIYYYDEDNISESRLAFRTAASIPIAYDQGDERGCRLTWGVGE